MMHWKLTKYGKLFTRKTNQLLQIFLSRQLSKGLEYATKESSILPALPSLTQELIPGRLWW